jgi:Na+/H+ antiporter NhaD/arsenite permease-like protein
MQPALQILQVRGDELRIRTPAQFFWATGSLSSVLDNAPTYLVFFKIGQAIPPTPGENVVAGVEEVRLIGISLGAVFMGAMTYIGNGPNFMVRAIAERAGVAMPSFFGYMVYSCLVLLPLFFLMMWLYLLFPY